MNKIETMPIEVNTQNTPTTLHLFRYKGHQEEKLSKNYLTALEVNQRLDQTSASIHKLDMQASARIDRLKQSAIEQRDALKGIRSSITCGTVFLKMREELSELTSQEFMDFFKMSLKVNTQLTQDAYSELKESSLLKLIAAKNRKSGPRAFSNLTAIMENVFDNPPAWFKGNKQSYKMFALRHINFGFYLDRDYFQDVLNGFARGSAFVQTAINASKTNMYGATIQGEFPDWFLEKNEAMPTDEEVKKELEDDIEQETMIKAGMQKIGDQGNYLTNSIVQKSEKANTHLLTLVRERFADFQTFADLVLGLKVFSPQHHSEQFNEMIRRFTDNKNLVSSPEPLALYIERKLREGKVINSSQEIIDNNFINLFTDAIDHIKMQDQAASPTKFQLLRQNNKRTFNTLNYEIRPFLELLSTDELSFLKDLLNESSDLPIESFIFDIASLVSSRFQNIKIADLTNSQLGAVSYLKKFTTSFLKNHASWLYEQIQSDLQQKPPSIEEDIRLPPDDLQNEIDDATDYLAQGNLKGWNVFYSQNKTTDPENLISIQGESLEERDEHLREYFLHEGISANIKSSSIIRAIEWVVGVPEEIEQLRMTKQIGEEKFKKLKRGNLRIFYIVAPAQKTIIFFTHQKKAWSYRF